MKLAKKLGIFVSGITTTFASTVVIASAYIPAVQAAEIGSKWNPKYEVAGDDIVYNGSFELDSLVDPNNPNVNNPNITGWSKSGDPLDTSLSQISNYPKSGYQSLSLANVVGPAAISQTLDTTKNQYYRLSYYLVAEEDASTANNLFEVFAGKNKLFSTENITYQPFTLYQFDFKAKDTTTLLTFNYENQAGFFYLDDVSVRPLIKSKDGSYEPVPEPFTVGGTAVAGLLGIWLKRKQTASLKES
ncbi:PEP-CTERM sorting domain-containing protein [Nostoc sp. UHCC 0302]|uniref:PEP-CTERM sorting domain-containing protein n=1 Tax=Nostoc sp. UHCC 0302 TaxID=3134896 RepID=UPI00311CA014